MNQNSPHLHRADRFAGMFAPAVVDLFAGCGGWSIGAERAFTAGGYRDRYIDLAINHWDVAVGVHNVNHPLTDHMHASVFEVDPNSVLPGRRIAYLHASPDCTDFSKAKGSRPRRKEIRALADVVLVWAGKRRPDVITLENVEEFQQWGPLLDSGQPDPTRRGDEFRRWVGELRALGYAVEWRELRACDYGAPTTRKRLFVVARCDGRNIVWPEKTHGQVNHRSDAAADLSPGVRGCHGGGVSGDGPARATTLCPRKLRGDQRRTRRVLGGSNEEIGGARPKSDAQGTGADCRHGLPSGYRFTADVKPYRTAAECIDWSLPMLSIFATPADAKAFGKLHGIGTPRRPLKANTLKRIARGVMKYVVNSARPFIVNIQNYGWGGAGVDPVDAPLRTVAGGPRGGGFAVADVTVAPFTAGVGGRAGQSPETSVDAPLPTITGKADRVVASATLAPFTVPNLGEREGQAPRCGSIEQPLPTVTAKGNGARLVAATLQTLNHGGDEHRAQSPAEPIRTITGANDARALVAALITKHRGESPGTNPGEPLHTVTSGAGAQRNAGAAHAMGIACAHLSHFYTSNTAGGEGDPRKPAKCITSGGQHAAVTVAMAAPLTIGAGGSAYAAKPKSVVDPLGTVMVNDRRSLVAAFLSTYYGNGGETAPDEPAPTVTGRDRIGLVTVIIDGQTYVITDIAMRMLTPRELARAQGFPESYVIERTIDGRSVTKADQVKLIGNSVCPPVAEAIVRANVVDQGVLDDVREAVSA